MNTAAGSAQPVVPMRERLPSAAGDGASDAEGSGLATACDARRMGLVRITLELPEDIAAHLAAQGENLSRAALEAFALEAYRAQKPNSGDCLDTTPGRRCMPF